MSEATRFGMAILVLWIAFTLAFFAFHPHGVKGISSPGDMLKWLIDEFGSLAGFTTATASDTTGTTSTENVTQTSDVGITGGPAVQVA